MEESISQILEKIREDICDNYCRYRDTADEEMQCDMPVQWKYDTELGIAYFCPH